jgi:hypothetical protein
MSELLLFPNSWPKKLGAAYTRANTVTHLVAIYSVSTVTYSFVVSDYPEYIPINPYLQAYR